MRTLLWLAVFQLIFCHAFAQGTTGSADTFPPGKTMIAAEIATNRLQNGITQTDSQPAITATIGYKWPQFRAGLWGSNFRNPPSDDSVNLRAFGAYKFIITSNLDMTARMDISHYASAGSANGNIMSVDINIYNYHVDLSQTENWEATEDSLTRFGFRKDFELATSWVWGLNLGYNSPNATTVVGYLDFKTKIGYKLQDMNFDLVASLTSNSDQLSGRGRPAVFLVFSVTPE